VVQYSLFIGFTLVSIDSLHLVRMEIPEAVKFSRGVSLRIAEAPARNRCFSRLCSPSAATETEKRR
jgi:hypothetical protein